MSSIASMIELSQVLSLDVDQLQYLALMDWSDRTKYTTAQNEFTYLVRAELDVVAKLMAILPIQSDRELLALLGILTHEKRSITESELLYARMTKKL